MQQFSIVLSFSAPNLGVADNMGESTYDEFFNLLTENGADYVGIRMVRGNLITDEIMQAAEELDNEIILDMNSGFNHNPLPEGMPEL